LDWTGQGRRSPPRQIYSYAHPYRLHRFAEWGEGDVKALQGMEELRLRIGDYRLIFVNQPADTRPAEAFAARRGKGKSLRFWDDNFFVGGSGERKEKG